MPLLYFLMEISWSTELCYRLIFLSTCNFWRYSSIENKKIGPSLFLLNNFNHQFYQSDLSLLVMVRNFYWSNLTVLFMVTKVSTTNKVQLNFVMIKSTGNLDWKKLIRKDIIFFRNEFSPIVKFVVTLCSKWGALFFAQIEI